MTATYSQLRAALAANLAASLTDMQVSAYALAQPTAPGVHILPGEIVYHGAMSNGAERYAFIVQAFADFSADIGAQARLDELLAPTGSQSVKAALESDGSLGGLAYAVVVTGASGYRLVERAGGGQLIAVDFRVDVHVSP